MNPTKKNLDPEPPFPENNKVSKYFPPGSWEKMEGYERNSYLNRYHNYKMMKHIGKKHNIMPTLVMIKTSFTLELARIV